MEQLRTLFYRLLAETNVPFKRYLYNRIDWNERLILIKGPKGVGKTTLIMQHIKEAFRDNLESVLWVSLDHVWFGSHSILELAEYLYSRGVTHLFLDEVHKYKNWQQEVKNIYDYYPKMHIVATGSSMLQIDASVKADLSRRHIAYRLDGLSFREFMVLEGHPDIGVFELDRIVRGHIQLASEISAKIKVLPLFEKYLKHGYYPFFKESVSRFPEKLQQAILNVIETDIPAVADLEYSSIRKIKQLLSVLSQETPYTLNIRNLTSKLEISRNTLVKLIDLLDRAAIMRKLEAEINDSGTLSKPEKLLFGDTNIMHALIEQPDKGTIRETFACSMLSHAHAIAMPTKGDILVDNHVLFEVGGKKKKFDQIKDIADSYVIADDKEIGEGNKIPLWLFGLLY